MSELCYKHTCEPLSFNQVMHKKFPTCSLVAFQYEASESISACTVSAEILTQLTNLQAVRLAPDRLIILENVL